MPKPLSQSIISPADRLHEVASILAHSVTHWRDHGKAGCFMPVSGPENGPKSGLDSCSETSLSVSRTRGHTSSI